MTQNDIAKHFRALHRPDNPLILTNVHDAPSASIIASLPTAPAIATTSYAIAQILNIPEESLTPAQHLPALKTIISAVRATNPTIPITVDLQDGYGADLAELNAIIKEVIALGAVGCNLEDMDNSTGHLRSLPDAVARVREAVAAAREAGVPDFVVNARTDVLLTPGATIQDAVERGRAFRGAGAWTVFVWGGPGGRGVSRDEVGLLARELDGMVNVKMNLAEGYLGVEQIRELGVARISVGPELWRMAMRTFKDQAMLLLGAS